MDLIGSAERAYLQRLREHPAAPKFNWTWTDQLTPEGLELVRCFQDQMALHPPRWEWGFAPDWVPLFAQQCLSRVSFYRDYGVSDWSSQLTTMNRRDLQAGPERFIPDGTDCSEMVYHETSGTTGTKVKILNHPVAGECYLPLLASALARVGVSFTMGGEQVALMLVFHHTTTLTYPQICPVLGGAAFVRLNLHPGHWAQPQDREAFLNFCAPQIYTGTPLSLTELAKLRLQHRPKALVTTSMALLPATRAFLQDHFQCPLIDLHSMAECRCVAARSHNGDMDLLAHDVFVEILDSNHQLCQPGERGEIVLTGGRNPFFPLLRYRTGDFASMVWPDPDLPKLTAIEGRAPVTFATPDGSQRNCIEVTRALADLPLTQFSLHQSHHGDLEFRFRGLPSLTAPIQQRLERLFQGQLPIKVEWVEESLGPKWIVYTSDYSPK